MSTPRTNGHITTEIKTYGVVCAVAGSFQSDSNNQQWNRSATAFCRKISGSSGILHNTKVPCGLPLPHKTTVAIIKMETNINLDETEIERVSNSGENALGGHALREAMLEVEEMLDACRTEADMCGPSASGFSGHEDDNRSQSSGSHLLTRDEKLKLDKAEFDFALGLDAISKIGWPLRSISEDMLYREKYSSFADYLAKRWALDPDVAKSLMAYRTHGYVRELGRILLPCDHPRADDLADIVHHTEWEDKSIEPEDVVAEELQRYINRTGKYQLPYGITPWVPVGEVQTSKQ